MKRYALLALGLAAALAVFAAFVAWRDYQRFLAGPIAVPGPSLVVDVPRGATVRGVLEGLDRRGVLAWDWRWRLLTRLEPVTLIAGEYEITEPMSPRALLAHLASGQVRQYRVTLIEGWTFRQALDALRSDRRLAQETEALDDAALRAAIGIEADSAEGWLLPETYQFTRGDSDLDILRRAHGAMRAALQTAWEGRDADLPLDTPYELLTLASIVEKETAVAGERPEVAGVFVRRLRAGWRLETDPTVIYGLGSAFDGDIRRRDLDTDTPYNTYTRHGLPPTPIALPGRASLMAVARPADGEAMFFVADGEGGHTFSVTLEEHNRAVRRLLERTP